MISEFTFHIPYMKKITLGAILAESKNKFTKEDGRV